MSTSVTPASSTSGEPSSSVSATTKSVRPPRNVHRLSSRPEPTPTLGPAIDFKVPSLPRQRTNPSIESSSSCTSTSSGRRPLKMVEDGNGPLSPRDDGASTPNRLKRLSLIARPSPLIESPNLNPEDRDRDGPMSARLSGDVNRTPRSLRMRSSISYSPASAPSRPTARSAVMSPEVDRHRDESASGGRGSMDGAAKGETWSDRHADLLQSIAQKQRRINELKQELQAEQSALYSLKSHFASLVSNTFSSPPPLNGQTSTLPIHRSTSNTTDTDWSFVSSAPSSHTSPNVNPEREERERDREPNPPGFSSLLDDVLGNAPLVDPSVVEGGRRFIGNLMRTVGAAAGGSVPPEKTEGRGEAEERQANKEVGSIGGMDISSIKGMFSSWSSASTTPRPNTVRIRPADPITRNIGSTPSSQSEM